MSPRPHAGRQAAIGRRWARRRDLVVGSSTWCAITLDVRAAFRDRGPDRGVETHVQQHDEHDEVTIWDEPASHRFQGTLRGALREKGMTLRYLTIAWMCAGTFVTAKKR